MNDYEIPWFLPSLSFDQFTERMTELVRFLGRPEPASLDEARWRPGDPCL